MAITIDQFLRDLTERQLLSTEDAHAVRRQLSARKTALLIQPPENNPKPLAIPLAWYSAIA